MSIEEIIQERRHSDDNYTIIHNILLEVHKTTTEIKDKVKSIEANQDSIESAFSKNDLGKIDYDGHRKDHLQIQKSHNVLEKYKFDITKSILVWTIGILGVIFFSGAIHQLAIILKVPTI